MSDQAVIQELIGRYDARTLAAGVRMVRQAKNARDQGALLVALLRRGTVTARLAEEDARAKAEAEARQREAQVRLEAARAALAEAAMAEAERAHARRVVEAASLERLREAVLRLLEEQPRLRRIVTGRNVCLDSRDELVRVALHPVLRTEVVSLLEAS